MAAQLHGELADGMVHITQVHWAVFPHHLAMGRIDLK
jgi:hypothetical protein